MVGDAATNKAHLLGELEALSSTRSDAAETRKKIWEKLAKEDGKQSSEEFVAELSQELGVPPITVQRWIRGDYGPRALTLRKLREHFGFAPVLAQKRQIGPDPPVLFGGEHSYAAIRTIDHFFFALEHARCCFVFKGKLGFHAGRQEKIRMRLVEALRGHNRTVYYIFRKGTEAEETFENLKKRVGQIDADVSSQIKAVPVSADDDELGLGMSFASPFLVKYDESGRQYFKRTVDIWYELPVERLDANNEVNDDQDLFAFVQLPLAESEKLWEKEWRKWLKGLSGIKKEDLED